MPLVCVCRKAQLLVRDAPRLCGEAKFGGSQSRKCLVFQIFDFVLCDIHTCNLSADQYFDFAYVSRCHVFHFTATQCLAHLCSGLQNRSSLSSLSCCSSMVRQHYFFFLQNAMLCFYSTIKNGLKNSLKKLINPLNNKMKE